MPRAKKVDPKEVTVNPEAEKATAKSDTLHLVVHHKTVLDNVRYYVMLGMLYFIWGSTSNSLIASIFGIVFTSIALYYLIKEW